MSRLQDLPVSVDLPPRLADEVSAYVEVEAGWQVVGRTGPPEPLLALTATVVDGPCVVITEGPVPPDAVAQALRGGALDVVAWPDERERLLSAPLRVSRRAESTVTPALISIGGAAGGVGASTVALAIGGLAAWAGARTLVIGDDDLLLLAGLAPWSGPGAVELAALEPQAAAAEAPGLALAAPGVDHLALLGGGAVISRFEQWPYDVVVADRRTPGSLGSTTLMVCGLDTSLRCAIQGEGRVLIRERGHVPLARARRALGSRLAGVLPESARVARAGLSGRVPSSLPGSWLAVLKEAVRALDG